MNLSNSVVLITGASRGLGLEVARIFARRGASLVITARGADALWKASEELALQTEVLAIPGDIADLVHAERLVREGLAQFGRIDVLINNASTVGPSPMPSLDLLAPEAFEEILRVNVVAPLHLIQLVLPQMKVRGEGLIINITSDAGVKAYAGWGGYGTSKAALEHLSRMLAEELRGTGIRVYLVDPGDMNTQMHREADPGLDLSHLPGPEVPAPAFVHLVEVETASFGRFEALRMVDGPS
ncbi:MAG: SDR family oxidoreductase [Armatimonadota bacterium]|nr:SDR family oxidoreductase [Armatimonadota bacterium]MDR5704300.1 SDR family oxidoreductase [Armatimonadota bacterium]MDR7433902.1 SDR family oxidoreductase [Armatimonadota bacterium]